MQDLYEIEFEYPEKNLKVRLPLTGDDDEAMDAARRLCEQMHGKLENAWRQDFPAFTIYRNGVEIGGG